MFKEYKRGDILIVELKTGDVFDGILYTHSPDRMSLCSAVEYPSGKLFENTCEFSIQEIKSIRTITNERTDQNTIFLDLSQYKLLTNLINSYQIIKQLDVRFFDAVKELQSCESVAVDAKGAQSGRFRKISYLVIASWSQVYVFDLTILDMIAFDTGIRDLLENEFILKVVHNSKLLNDCLHHKYNVKLSNVFDTLIADHTLQKRKNEPNAKFRSLAECTSLYFNMPASYIDQFTDEEFDQKPLPVDLRESIAIKCSFLTLLKNCLQQHLNRSLHHMTDLYYGMHSVNGPPLAEKYFPDSILAELATTSKAESPVN